MPGIEESELAEAAQLSSLADETPEGRSIVVLAKAVRDPRARARSRTRRSSSPSRRETRMSGVDVNGNAATARAPATRSSRFVEAQGGRPPAELQEQLDRIGREGGTPLAVCRDNHVLGVVYLKDIVKEGMRARFDELRADGHPHGDGDRRQPPHRGEDRRGVGRRRLPRRSDARSRSSS